jgi:hypothetical protein
MLLMFLCLVAAPAAGQTPPAASEQAAAPTTPPVPQRDPDRAPDPLEPEFTLAALPTTLRMPAGAFTFRMTHRFSRPLAEGSVGDLAADLFGFDGSAKIGLELRYGIRPGTQATVHRTNDRAIQWLGQHEVLRQDDVQPVTVDAIVAVEGANNFSEDFGGAIGAVVSRRLAGRGAVYAQPILVLNSDPRPGGETGDNHTLMLGLGARLRLGESNVYIVAEAAPRLAGFDAGVHHLSVAIEKRYGGHVFQLNVSNSLGTTMRQLARGGPASEDWFIGFNLVRRFF